MEYWGYHLLLDCSASPLEYVQDRDRICNFARHLVRDIDMKAYGEPIVEHFAADDPDKAGYTLVQLIETSNITAHFVDKNGNIYMDIFSCKPFNIEVAIKTVRQYFEPKKIKQHFVTRDADPYCSGCDDWHAGPRCYS